MRTNKSKRQHEAYRRALINVIKPLVALMTVFAMLGAGEFYFRVIHLESDGFYMTMMGQRWYRECWNPLFTLSNPAYPDDNGTVAYRDRTWTADDLIGKRKIVVLGDSFAAGHGVCDVSQRFSDQLGAQLGSDYAVMNAAHNGWNTPEEAFFARYYPFDPDVVVLSYYLNDIAPAIASTPNSTIKIPELYERPVDNLTAQLVNRSYLADYIYWHVLVQRQWSASGESITDTYLKAYNDPAIWQTHSQELQQIINWVHSKNAKMIVVVWPILYSVEQSNEAVDKVSQLFQAQGIPVINTADLFAGRSTNDLIISNIDAHPSVFAHTEVGKALYTTIKQLGW
ncbi:MAG: SGNH/GDSL hydrolase family protein [Anaerolineae bacterium]|nr:SGNH/GDSL hydrolase family protein [Anaerolineae bacterium]